jgi:hypothetical protein
MDDLIRSVPPDVLEGMVAALIQKVAASYKGYRYSGKDALLVNLKLLSPLAEINGREITIKLPLDLADPKLRRFIENTIGRKLSQTEKRFDLKSIVNRTVFIAIRTNSRGDVVPVAVYALSRLRSDQNLLASVRPSCYGAHSICQDELKGLCPWQANCEKIAPEATAATPALVVDLIDTTAIGDADGGEKAETTPSTDHQL